MLLTAGRRLDGLKPHGLDGGPDEPTLRRLVVQEDYNDSEIAQLYGVSRPTVAYWRKKHGMPTPGAGHGRPRRRPRGSHKALIHWTVRAEHVNLPIRKRLVEVSRLWQGLPMAPDERGRAEEFLQMLERNNVVVDYDPANLANGEPAPFFFRPRDPKVDAPGDIVRR